MAGLMVWDSYLGCQDSHVLFAQIKNWKPSRIERTVADILLHIALLQTLDSLATVGVFRRKLDRDAHDEAGGDFVLKLTTLLRSLRV